MIFLFVSRIRSIRARFRFDPGDIVEPGNSWWVDDSCDGWDDKVLLSDRESCGAFEGECLVFRGELCPWRREGVDEWDGIVIGDGLDFIR
jgi:hypothetical protein